MSGSVENVASERLAGQVILGGCYDIVKREIKIGHLTLKSKNQSTSIELKKIKEADWKREHIPFSGTDKDLLTMRAYILAAQLELMISWQEYNQGRSKEDTLPWD